MAEPSHEPLNNGGRLLKLPSIDSSQSEPTPPHITGPQELPAIKPDHRPHNAETPVIKGIQPDPADTRADLYATRMADTPQPQQK